MKISIILTVLLSLCLAVGTSIGAPAPKDSSAQKRGTNSSAMEPEIPSSVFVVPTEPKEGKDPFFPASKRPYVHLVAHATNAPASLPAKLILNGISRKLAMINGRTFSEGEEGDVNTENGRKHVRCIRIKEDSAMIEILENGTAVDRQELRLRSPY